MASTNTVACSPPPTTNTLDAAQRARVIRSSRKLGAVLGTTPFLLESCGGTVLVPTTLHPATKRGTHAPSPTKRHHRQREGTSTASSETSPLLSSPRTSASSEESLLHLPNSSTDKLPALVLTKPRSGHDTPRPLVLRLNSIPLSPSDLHVQTVPPSPLSPNADIPPTPATPKEPSRREARRRKMARVVRTLGENVPPELVFKPSDMVWSENPPLSTTRTHEVRSGSPTRSTAKSTRPRSASLDSSSQWQRLLELPAPVFSSSTRAPADQQWVGAWNRRNIAQVQRELRALRHR
jgi:hypothetical protein